MNIQAQPVALTYRLGEYSVGAARLMMGSAQAHFTELTTAFEEPAVIPEPLDGILLRSQPVAAPLPRLTINRHLIRYVPAQYQRYYIDLTIGMENYLAKFSPKSRSTLKRKVRKFGDASGGAIDWREYRTVEELEIFYPLARAISQKTYQERLLQAGLPDDAAFRSQMRRLAQDAAVRAYLLFQNQEPVAYLYCPLYKGILMYEYLGYDPAYADQSPGTVLQWLVVEKLFAEGGYRMFDFTQGEGAHKALFATHSQPCADIYFLRRSPVNLLRVMLHAGLNDFSTGTVKLIDRLGLKSRIKKMLRKAG